MVAPAITDPECRACRRPDRGGRARSWAARMTHRLVRPTVIGKRERSAWAPFPAAWRRAARHRATGSTAPGERAVPSPGDRIRLRRTREDRTAAHATAEAADLSRSSHDPGRPVQGRSSQVRSSQGRSCRDSRVRGLRDQAPSTTGRMPAASPAPVRFPCPAAPAGQAQLDFTGQEARAARRPAIRYRSRVGFQPGRCRPARSRRGDPSRGNSRRDTPAPGTPRTSGGSRRDPVLFRPRRCRPASSCPAPARRTADRRLLGSLLRQARSPSLVSLRSLVSSPSLVSSVLVSCPAGRCRAGRSLRRLSTARPVITAQAGRSPRAGWEPDRSRQVRSPPGRPVHSGGPGQDRRHRVLRGSDATSVRSAIRQRLTAVRARSPALPSSRTAGLGQVTTPTTMGTECSPRRPSTRQAA
jgi:hypothetical protein